MTKVLLTGRTGFIGRNILPHLNDKYNLTAPTRQELDLRDYSAVKQFIECGNYDVIFHSANPNPVKNDADNLNRMFEDSMHVFMNFYHMKDYYGKLIYIGSGAEYDKRFDMNQVSEDDFGIKLPTDTYGFSKFIMNELAVKSENIYNMRLYACYGPYDHGSKFITHAINCCLNEQPITIRQDCWFDYLHVYDFSKIACWFIDENPQHHDYNICSGNPITLMKIAQIVNEQFDHKVEIQIMNEGFNKAYTGNNQRLLSEIGKFEFIPIEKGIEMQIDWQRRSIK